MPLARAAARGEIREGVFSDAINGGLGRLAAQTSGVKNPVSTGFFTLAITKDIMQNLTVQFTQFPKPEVSHEYVSGI